MRPSFLSAQWRSLLMLNYEADPAVLLPFVPTGTELDRWHGTTFVTVVGFRFLGARLLGVPIPFHQTFDEVNLRFYVRRRMPEGWRRGVVFLKEIVPHRMVTAVARWVFRESFSTCRTASEIRLPSPSAARGRVSYRWWLSGVANQIAADIVGPCSMPSRDSTEAFVVEHFWAYSGPRRRRTREYEVPHPPWRIWPAIDARLECDVEQCYGRVFVPILTDRPSFAFVADGSAVRVYHGDRMPRRNGSDAEVGEELGQLPNEAGDEGGLRLGGHDRAGDALAGRRQ